MTLFDVDDVFLFHWRAWMSRDPGGLEVPWK
jgi:hypothetical protein